MFIIFDLDGTLANIEHRVHFIRDGRKNWPAFFKACVDDVPVQPIIDTAKALLASGHRVEIWSGRSDEVRPATEKWLEDAGIGSLPLKMRAAGDYTPDDHLKEQWLLAESSPPDLIFDDRAKVVAMWRRHGIICAQVATGNF